MKKLDGLCEFLRRTEAEIEEQFNTFAETYSEFCSLVDKQVNETRLEILFRDVEPHIKMMPICEMNREKSLEFVFAFKTWWDELFKILAGLHLTESDWELVFEMIVGKLNLAYPFKDYRYQLQDMHRRLPQNVRLRKKVHRILKKDSKKAKVLGGVIYKARIDAKKDFRRLEMLKNLVNLKSLEIYNLPIEDTKKLEDLIINIRKAGGFVNLRDKDIIVHTIKYDLDGPK